MVMLPVKSDLYEIKSGLYFYMINLASCVFHRKIKKMMATGYLLYEISRYL